MNENYLSFSQIQAQSQSSRPSLPPSLFFLAMLFLHPTLFLFIFDKFYLFHS